MKHHVLLLCLATACADDSAADGTGGTAGSGSTSTASIDPTTSTAGTTTNTAPTGTGDTSDTGETVDSSSSGSTGEPEPQCPDTRFPGSIDGVEPESHSHHPPLAISGDLYRVVESPQDDGNDPKMMKSSDGGATWSEIDENNRPDVNDLEGMYQLQVDDIVYFTLTRGPQVWWFAFDTAIDQWTLTEEVDDDLTSGGVVQFSSLAQTSDGQFWLAYSDIVLGGRQQIALRRRTGPDAYDPKITIDDPGESWTGPRLVLGADDVTHLFYAAEDDNILYWRTVSPTGEVSDRVRVDTNGTSQVSVPHTHAVVYDRDGTEVIALAFSGADDNLKAVTITDGVVGPEEELSTTAVLQDADVVANEGAVAHVALQGDDTVHVVWTEEDTGDVLHRSRPDEGAWSDTQTIWSSENEAALYIYCSVLESGNCPRLACTYDVGPHGDDTGQIEYLEFVL